MPWDNAVFKAFFASLKREEISHKYYSSSEELKRDVTDYVDFYNNMRPHENLGMLTPREKERQFELKKKIRGILEFQLELSKNPDMTKWWWP